jgi:hypothetical protein
MMIGTSSRCLFGILLLTLAIVGSHAFVVPATTTCSTTNSRRSASKNFADEILDALDTMMGVSPLAETDLKPSSSSSSSSSSSREQKGEMERLLQRAKVREDLAPPKDALQKPSVAIFFALLGIVPSLLFLSAVQNGFRPFGLN